MQNSIKFLNVPESYISDEPVTCQYSLNTDQPLDLDCIIGVYVVGWRTPTDVVVFKSHKFSIAETHDNTTVYTLTFSVRELSQNPDEFYQFCCFNDTSQILGISEPFQFVADDFEVIDDQNIGTASSLLVVSKQDFADGVEISQQQSVTTADTAAQVKELNDEVSQLRQRLEESTKLQTSALDDKQVGQLNNEISQLHEEISKCEKLRAATVDENNRLQSQLKMLDEHLSTINDEFQKQIDALTKERDDWKASTLQLRQELTEKSATQTAMQGDIEALTEERELLKQEKTELQKELDSGESLAASHNALQIAYNSVSEMNKALVVRSNKLEEDNARLQKLHMDDLDQIRCLQSNLKTSEDMINELCSQSDFHQCSFTSTNRKNHDQHQKQRDLLNFDDDCQECESEVMTYYPVETMFTNPYIEYIPEVFRNK